MSKELPCFGKPEAVAKRMRRKIQTESIDGKDKRKYRRKQGRGCRNQEATGGRIGDNTGRKGRGYRHQETTEGGGSPTIQGETVEAIGINRPQRGEDRRQCREKRLRLLESTGHRRGGSPTERNGRDYRRGGSIADNTGRKSRCSRNQDATEG